MRPPLTAAALEILRLHHAGRSPEQIALAGWHRGSWTPADVAAVIRDWGTRDRETIYRPDPAGSEIPHGTYKGYIRCQRLHGSAGVCEPCREAHRVYSREQKAGLHRRTAS